MDTFDQWENTTSTKPRPTMAYGMQHSSSAACSLQVHELYPTEPIKDGETILFVTLTTFDGELVLLRNCNQTGKLQNNQSFFTEYAKIQTHYPIVQCWLELQYVSHLNEDHVIGFLADIFGNVYHVDFSSIPAQLKKYGIPQRVKYETLYLNTDIPFPDQPDQLYREYPLLLRKRDSNLLTFNLRGQLLLLNLSLSKSLMRATSVIPQKVNFDEEGLAASCNSTNCNLGDVVVLVTNNRRIPYVFVNCESAQDFNLSRQLQNNYYLEWEEEAKEITWCSFDPTTALVAVCLITQQLELFEIQEVREGGASFHVCHRKFRFHVNGGINLGANKENMIEHMQARKGLLVLVSCKEYILVDLTTREVKKRGKSGTLDKLKWTQLVDRDNTSICILLLKGYNHYNPEQSKMGRPNLHFKVFDFARNK